MQSFLLPRQTITLHETNTYRRISRRFSTESLKKTNKVSENISVRTPNPIHFRRQSRNQQQHIGHGQTEQVIVCGRVHTLILSDHYARAYIADHAGEKNHRVHYCEGYH